MRRMKRRHLIPSFVPIRGVPTNAVIVYLVNSFSIGNKRSQ